MSMQTQEIRASDLVNRPKAQSEIYTAPGADDRDLGLGRVVTETSRGRLLNRDGSFNVRRLGQSFAERFAPYHEILALSWPRFLGAVGSFYLGINLVFAAAYWLLGPNALSGTAGDTPLERLGHAFFFSVQTFATIGYGQIGPASLAANIVTVVEALVGLLCVALLTGLFFARFARPTAAIRFSKALLITPYGDGLSLQFRMANQRSSELIELRVRVLFARFETAPDGRRLRRFTELALERDRVTFFPLAWTVVHPITQESPIAGLAVDQLEAMQAEFLVLVKGTDETFATEVHARTSYRPADLVVGARFTDITDSGSSDGHLTIDLSRLDSLQRV
jgi:inward rectifier potassium channel